MDESLSAVILTGPSSSGKSSVARVLQSRLPDLWLHVSIDAYFNMIDLSHPRLQPKPMTALSSLGFFTGVVASWRALVDHGNRLLVDVVANRLLLADCARIFRGTRVLVVRLTSTPEVLDGRESARGDRPAGMAREQSAYFDQALVGADDLLIDTSDRSVEDVATAVVGAMASPPETLVLERWELPQ